jgi:hypothetical protein
VLVRRAGEHRGAVGVPVYFLDSSMLDEDRTDLDGQALRRGLCFTSGADGMAIVPEPVGDFRVLAMDDGWFGRTTEIGPGRRLEIVLGRDELVRVRVVDEQKQPSAGVPVRLFTRSESGKSGWVHEVVESAENGIATLHPRRAEGRGDWFVSLAIEDPDAVELAVDPHTLPREPLSLVLPDHGAVDVLVTDRDGQPDRRVETLWLEFENEAKSAARRLEPRALLQRPLHEGRATFPFVRADTLFAVKGPGVESPLVPSPSGRAAHGRGRGLPSRPQRRHARPRGPGCALRRWTRAHPRGRRSAGMEQRVDPPHGRRRSRLLVLLRPGCRALLPDGSGLRRSLPGAALGAVRDRAARGRERARRSLALADAGARVRGRRGRERSADRGRRRPVRRAARGPRRRAGVARGPGHGLRARRHVRPSRRDGQRSAPAGGHAQRLRAAARCLPEPGCERCARRAREARTHRRQGAV